MKQARTAPLEVLNVSLEQAKTRAGSGPATLDIPVSLFA
jgi:hypothetical protein